LVIWQVSFKFDEYPENLSQTFIFLAVSTLIFVLTITLGFILFRDGIKLVIRSRHNREGSRIESKLYFGALALSFMPVCFLVAFSYMVLNRQVEKWFFRPAENVKLNYQAIDRAFDKELREKLELQAAALAGRAQAGQTGFLQSVCREWNLAAVEIASIPGGDVIARCGDPAALRSPRKNIRTARVGIHEGTPEAASISIAAKVPLDIAAAQAQIETYLKRIDELDRQKKSVRSFYIMMQALIALFTLFVSTWIARLLARQISGPIAALLRAADAVGEGNFSYRVEVGAIDELAGMVRGFNAMTRQLQANRDELEARRRFSEAILESIPNGVISVSADGRIQKVNRALSKIFPQAVVERARRLEDLFPREDTAELRYMMKRARRTGSTSREMELRTDKQTLHLAITVSALDERLTSAFVIVLEDTSDLLRAQKAAAWREVARRIAHEIRNPLTPIALSAERIGRQVERLGLPTETSRILRECTAIIGKEVESVKSLVSEFSQFARFPTAQLSRCDLNVVVNDALSVFRGRLDGIHVKSHLTQGLPAVLVDSEQFKRVVVNLVDNAAEAMQNSLIKELRISTQSGAGDTVDLVVADTGCGVSAEDKERLFLPYFSTKGRGTGLGLAIVNHIVSEHNGVIRVEDNQPVGARFTVEIPIFVEPDEPKAAPAEAAADPLVVRP
ncbi:MAG TPA: ATP-binding protein, partial [Bryobacteraceae bacterium]|nr:ATP-binding protein [Bryobacteraceae bacterium]